MLYLRYFVFYIINIYQCYYSESLPTLPVQEV